MDKKKEIEEIKRIIDKRCEAELGQVHTNSKDGKVTKTVDTSLIAKDIYEQCYCKIDKDNILIARDEYEQLKSIYKEYLDLHRNSFSVLSELENKLYDSEMLNEELQNKLKQEKEEAASLIEQLKAEKLSVVCDLNMRILELDNENKERKNVIEEFVTELKAYIYDNDNLIEIIDKLAKKFNAEIKE